MKVLHISTIDIGGAANSCIRLHQGLLNNGVDSKVLVLKRHKPGTKNVFRYVSEYSRLQLLRSKLRLILSKLRIFPAEGKFKHWLMLRNKVKGFEVFSFSDTVYDITLHPLYKEADIINLHWTAGFLDYKSFFKKNTKHIVWTLHDMNPFTGGCHYSGPCNEFEDACRKCPQLQHTINATYSKTILKDKVGALITLKELIVVSPSAWLLNQSSKSQLFKRFKHLHIPYGIDKNLFSPINRDTAKDIVGVAGNKKVILFVADYINNKRKGYHLLVEAIRQLDDPEYVLCAVGAESCNAGGLNIIELGRITNERFMRIVYSAADVFVIPSIEDNLPNTVLESLMCGTPVVGFPIGGVVDMIINNVNGKVCENITPESLVKAIKGIISDEAHYDRERIRHEAIEKYDLKVQALEYTKLYTDIISGRF